MSDRDAAEDPTPPDPQALAVAGLEAAVERLGADPERGLAGEIARCRCRRWGRNAIEEEGTHPLIKALAHFWGPIPWMIEVAAVLAAVAGRWEDFALIATMLAINGVVGFWHEHKAHRAIAALKAQLAPTAVVVRRDPPVSTGTGAFRSRLPLGAGSYKTDPAVGRLATRS